MNSAPGFTRVASLKTPEAFLRHLESLGVVLPFVETLADASESPLAARLQHRERTIGNRFCILPMEGWDGTHQGDAGDLTLRRWKHFGSSGAKLIWGGEAVAVRPDGRANPNQLMARDENLGSLRRLREVLLEEHERLYRRSDDLFLGLQLTHSGRFARPREKQKLEPQIVYHHPILDARFGIPPDYPCLSDDEIEGIIAEFVAAAQRAAALGFDFVDIKHCHGYLGHEFLSACSRPGPFGGSFENRTRFLRRVVSGIRKAAPGLDIGVRLSAFDFVPFEKDADGLGTPDRGGLETYPYAFGSDAENPLEIRLTETRAFLKLLVDLGIRLVCVSAGSPYYNPHIQRPALFPPSDGYLPPEDPLVGVARQIGVTARLKADFRELNFVGSAYSYLQEWLPNVAQAAVESGQVDCVGLGRLVLSYPEFPADVLGGRPLRPKSICRTFSDCTTGPRNGLVSGCFPLDPFYKEHPDAEALKRVKQSLREARV